MAENNSEELENMRSQLAKLVKDYTNLIKNVPIVKLDSDNLDNIIENLKTEEDKMRNSEEQMNNIFQTALKMLELRVNANILHQHFIGCLNVANNCEDLMCFKIFMSQAYTAMLQMLQFIRKFLEIFSQTKVDDLLNQMNSLQTQTGVLKSFDDKSKEFLDRIDEIVQDLNEKVKEMPHKLY